MRVLVAGGFGFIGCNFIRYILSVEDDVVVVNLDRLSYGSNPSNLRGVDGSRYRFVRGDINDLGLLSNLLGDVDVVVNFAAETHVDRSISSPLSFVNSNVVGVCSLLEALRLCNRDLRLVHISTDEVYGDIAEGSFSEVDGLRPSSPYAASKASADLLCQAYHRTYGLDIVIVRPTNNFGPYQFPEKLIPKTIIRAKLGLKVPVYGTGKNVRDWIYVLDTCEAIHLAMRRGARGEIYNVSAGNELTNLEIINRILEIMGRDGGLIEFVDDRPGHDIRYSLDSTKIRRELGWRPRHDFDEALRYTVKWYLENEGWWKPLLDEKILHETPWRLRW